MKIMCCLPILLPYSECSSSNLFTWIKPMTTPYLTLNWTKGTIYKYCKQIHFRELFIYFHEKFEKINCHKNDHYNTVRCSCIVQLCSLHENVHETVNAIVNSRKYMLVYSELHCVIFHMPTRLMISDLVFCSLHI